MTCQPILGMKLTQNIRERAYETTTLDSTNNLCYSNDRGGDKGGAKETSRTFLQSLRDAEIQ